MVVGFPPIVGSDAEVLILGTMPSVKSLYRQQYYGHPQNTFWPIVYDLWDQPPPGDYEQRKQFLMAHRIALWDVLMACEREGSADSAIESPRANDFVWLASQCPHLKAVVFNSQNAARFYQTMVRPDPFVHLSKITLPSTSPARAMKWETKREAWSALKTLLDDPKILDGPPACF